MNQPTGAAPGVSLQKSFACIGARTSTTLFAGSAPPKPIRVVKGPKIRLEANPVPTAWNRRKADDIVILRRCTNLQMHKRGDTPRFPQPDTNERISESKPFLLLGVLGRASLFLLVFNGPMGASMYCTSASCMGDSRMVSALFGPGSLGHLVASRPTNHTGRYCRSETTAANCFPSWQAYSWALRSTKNTNQLDGTLAILKYALTKQPGHGWLQLPMFFLGKFVQAIPLALLCTLALRPGKRFLALARKLKQAKVGRRYPGRLDEMVGHG